MADKKISTKKIVGFTLLGVFLIIILNGSCFLIGLFTGSTGSAISSVASESIYEIRLEGLISGSTESSLLTGVSITPESIMKQLKTAEESPGVKAILIRVNSGGGSAAASQEIYEELKKVDKPVVVSISDICASGAYYIACASDVIVANRSSSVGSIGVIMQIPNLEELFDKVGIKYTTIKQGKYKDIGSSDRPLTEEEEELLQNQTEKVYRQFISDVAEERNMTIEEIEELATGWIYIGTEALELGLIDEIGTYNDAIEIASDLGGIKGEPHIIREEEISVLDMVLKYYFSEVSRRINSFGNLRYPVFR